MQVEFGKHRGEHVDQVLFNSPAYIMWAFSQPEPGWRMKAVIEEAQSLIRVFNEKPFAVMCDNNRCHRRAALGYVMVGKMNLRFRCKKCAKLVATKDFHKIDSFERALFYIKMYFSSDEKAPAQIIRQFANAKGVPDGANRKARLTYFESASDVIDYRRSRVKKSETNNKRTIFKLKGRQIL